MTHQNISCLPPPYLFRTFYFLPCFLPYCSTILLFVCPIVIIPLPSSSFTFLTLISFPHFSYIPFPILLSNLLLYPSPFPSNGRRNFGVSPNPRNKLQSCRAVRFPQAGHVLSIICMIMFGKYGDNESVCGKETKNAPKMHLCVPYKCFEIKWHTPAAGLC
jgi:hypothetical protein